MQAKNIIPGNFSTIGNDVPVIFTDHLGPSSYITQLGDKANFIGSMAFFDSANRQVRLIHRSYGNNILLIVGQFTVSRVLRDLKINGEAVTYREMCALIREQGTLNIDNFYGDFLSDMETGGLCELTVKVPFFESGDDSIYPTKASELNILAEFVDASGNVKNYDPKQGSEQLVHVVCDGMEAYLNQGFMYHAEYLQKVFNSHGIPCFFTSETATAEVPDTESNEPRRIALLA